MSLKMNKIIELGGKMAAPADLAERARKIADRRKRRRFISES
jgi:hypothetical protein